MLISSNRRRALASAGAGIVMLASAWGMYAAGSQNGYQIGLLTGAGFGLLLLAVLLWWMPFAGCDSAPKALAQRYRRDFVPPMIAYVAVMLFWKNLLDHVDAHWLRVVVALLPALLVMLVIRAMARYVRDSDELQRRIELESVSLAAGVVAALYMTGGFLQSAQLINIPSTLSMLWVFPLLCFLYGMFKAIIGRRFA